MILISLPYYHYAQIIFFHLLKSGLLPLFRFSFFFLMPSERCLIYMVYNGYLLPDSSFQSTILQRCRLPEIEIFHIH